MKTIVLVLAVGIGFATVAGAANKDYSETVLYSTATLKETDEYVWKISGEDSIVKYLYLSRDSNFYSIEKTTETVKVCPSGKCWEKAQIWTKYRKVYDEIEATECVEWEHEYWRQSVNPSLADRVYKVHSGSCTRELVYMKDGRVLWRKVGGEGKGR